MRSVSGCFACISAIFIPRTVICTGRPQPALGTRLGHDLPVIEVPENGFRTVLKLAADFDNYGDGTMCGFNPGVALLLGDQPEPDLILICCFQCHDVHIVRRPTTEHPKTRVAEVGMSPELERAISLRSRRPAIPRTKNFSHSIWRIESAQRLL